MSRNYPNWIRAYLAHTAHLEAPDVFHIWTAIGTVAGALSGKCFIDMGHFVWKPNFFIVFVAPPGIISKSTTANVGMGLLRSVEGVHFGPESVTWQALTDAFRDAETLVPEIAKKVSPLNIVASELGTFLDPKNRELIDVLNDMWDGRNVPWQRRTKGEGASEVQNPWLNFVGCTTPAWIQENFPQYAIGGGFTSRTVFVYGDTKRRLIAYPKEEMALQDYQLVRERLRLISDLKSISKITGEFFLTPDAIRWGKEWYEQHWTISSNAGLDRELHGGYVARKQTHLHKIAMVLSAAERSDKLITADDLDCAKDLLTSLEPGFSRVFSAIADNREVHYLATLIRLVASHPSGITKRDVWRKLSAVMTLEQFEACLDGAIKGDFIYEYAGSANSPSGPILKPHRVELFDGKVAGTPSRLVNPAPSSSSALSSASSSAGSSPASDEAAAQAHPD
jgi:hypothetical protein